MQEKKVDRRVKYTKQALKMSLIEALQQKPIEKITVKEICEGADVNRGTFYSHYTDQIDLYDDVVYEVIQNGIELTDGILDVHERFHNKVNMVVAIYRYVKENADLIRALLNNISIFGFNKYTDKFNEVVHKVYLDEIKQEVEDHAFVDMVYQYVAAANLTLIQYWLNTGMKETEEEMAILAMKLTGKGLSGLDK